MKKQAEKNKYGERIRDLREKMGLSQGDFADVAGVTARAQRNYEAGLRTPNIRYLESLAEVGRVDVGYILTGVMTNEFDMNEAKAFRWLAKSLGLDTGFQIAATTAFYRLSEVGFDNAALDSELDALLALYKVAVIDAQLLSGIIESVEKLAPSIDPRKKAGVVTLLYRSFRGAGRIDEKAVIEAVELTK